MPRTREQLQQALTDAETWLDSLDPKALGLPDSDGADLLAIGEALRVVAASDLSLAERVAQARANGRTWTQIAAVLGVTKQAARERFGETAHR
ncbi:MAG: sigma-70 family RNA polymerase sigma factor [Actinomycetota bacterium]|nr:sigma-70 family RNA polymerase sigma factor [Actinomycetota bacterium]